MSVYPGRHKPFFKADCFQVYHTSPANACIIHNLCMHDGFPVNEDYADNSLDHDYEERVDAYVRGYLYLTS